jgi:hypothetical protein
MKGIYQMAKKEHRISVNALENIAEVQYPNVITEEWAGIEVTIKRALSLSEMVEFVADLVEACIDDKGEYSPEAYDFMSRVNVLTKYANFTMPADIKKQYALVYQTDAYEFVLGHINSSQFYDLCGAADMRINRELNMDVRSTRAMLSELVERFGDIANRLEESMSSVTAEDIKSMASAVGSGVVDEKKIVSAYIDTKRNADVP